MKAPPHPFPLATLLDAAHIGDGEQGIVSLGPVVARAIYRIRKFQDGYLSVRQADLWAVRFGFHPCEVWPDWFGWNPTGKPHHHPLASPQAVGQT